MATTKVIKELTEFNPGNPDYILNATNAVTVINSGGNQYNFNGVYGKFGLRIGTTVLTGVPSGHPFAVLNNGLTGITYTGTVNEGTLAVGGFTYTFYSGDITITVTADFGVASYYCKIHGYMGGQDNLVSVYSEAGLRMPSSNAAYSGPTAEEGMMRNEVGQVSNLSASCMQHFNGTDWKNFVNTVQCTTTTCNYPTTATLLYQMESDGGSANNVPDTCSNYNGTSVDVSYATGKYGNAGVFNGSSSVINIAKAAVNAASPYTISMWFNADTASSYEGFYSGISSSPVIGEFAFLKSNANTIRVFSVATNGSNNLDGLNATIPTLSNSTWYNLVVIADRSLTYKSRVFINGVEGTSYSGLVASTNLLADIKIGFADNNYFDGLIDQVRFFPSALNQTQITQLANEVGC